MSYFDLLTYNFLQKNIPKFLNNTIFHNIISKNNYFIINIKNKFNKINKYHITIFEDQWNKYISPSKISSKLFHITNEISKCSIYFILKDDMTIIEVPKSDFKYEQSEFNNYASTRIKCIDKNINIIIKEFTNVIQNIVHDIENKCNNNCKNKLPIKKIAVNYY